MPRPRTAASPFRYFNSSPEVIRLAVLLYVKYPLSLRNVEDLLAERGIDISHETVRYWWNRFGPLFASDIRRQRVSSMRRFRHWRRHLDEMVVKVNGEMRYLWRAVDHEGEILESFVARERDKAAALKFMKKALRRHGSPGANEDYISRCRRLNSASRSSLMPISPATRLPVSSECGRRTNQRTGLPVGQVRHRPIADFLPASTMLL
jgi:transposase-like protein